MLYKIVRPIAKLGIRIFFRKLHLSNTHRIPQGKPVILAANHPTGFMEPCVLACFLDKPLHFLVRGNMFKKQHHNAVLRALNMLPVYRIQDRGYKFVKSNYETFDFCYDALYEGKTLMILAEGRAEHEKRLRPLKKGTARIAFGTIERYPDIEDVYVVPVGVNYTYAEYPRTDIMIDFGEPIRIREYEEAYRQNPNQTAADFTDELSRRMAERIVIIEKESDEALTEYLLRIDRTRRPEPVLPFLTNQETPLRAEKAVADQVNAIADSTAKATLLQKAQQYFKRIDAIGTDDAAFVKGKRPSFVAWLLLALGLPFFLIGYAANVLPYLLARRIARQRVRRTEFYTSVLWAVSMGAFLLYGLLWLLLLLLLAPVVWLLLLLIIPALGYFALLYAEFFQRKRRAMRAASLPAEQRKELLQLRAELAQALPTASAQD